MLRAPPLRDRQAGLTTGALKSVVAGPRRGSWRSLSSPVGACSMRRPPTSFESLSAAAPR